MILDCYLCGRVKDFNLLVHHSEMRFNCYDKTHKILQCNKCKLIQLNPQWKEKELNEIYKNYSQVKDFKNQKLDKRNITRYLRKYLPKIKDKHSILEVGCGKGDNVYYLKKLGCNILGIDKDPSVCKNNTIINFDYKEMLPINFTFIYGIQFLEHLTNPIHFLNWSYDRLENEGKLLLEIPNIEDPLLVLYKNKQFKKFYYRPDHHYFYSPNTIEQILNRSNFIKYRIKLYQRYGIFNHLNWLIRRKPSNFNPHIPLLDNIYKWFLTHILKISDTLLIIIDKETT